MNRSWQLPTIPQDVADRYLKEGWWTDDTIGSTVATGLARLADNEFTVWSKLRPFRGTFRQLDRAARQFASALTTAGVGPGDAVVFQLPNWVEAAITFWGAAYVGAVVIPIVHTYGAKEVDYILRTVRPDVVVTADRFGRADYLDTYDNLLAQAPTRAWFVAGDTAADALPARATAFAAIENLDPLGRFPDIDPGMPAIVGFTSGTTRDPKGVVHSHRTILCEAQQLNSMSPPIGPPSLIGTPVGHFMGMTGALLVPLLRDKPVNMIDAWDPAEVLRIMLADGLSLGGAAPFFLTSLLDHPDFTDEHLKLMPFMGLGGAAVPASVSERATRLGITVYRSYGSTEHPSITTSFLDEPADKRLHTDGHPLPGVELRLDDEGQILSKGPDRFLGYTDPELTSSAFDADGWYRTGDVGTLDEDGYLTITDRISDVIIRGGENISAQEVEELLLTMPGIAEAYVVAAPDPRLGERAAAVIRTIPGEPMPSLAEITSHLQQAGLARQKWPESLHAVDDFPRTPSGKVQKFRLRDSLRAGTL